MVVAELAYQRMTPAQRQAILAILRQHPHWDEYLIADRPENVPEEQWAFWRAATWPDWVKHHHEQFSHPKWHYVDLPFVPPGSAECAENHEPGGENVPPRFRCASTRCAVHPAKREPSTCAGSCTWSATFTNHCTR